MRNANRANKRAANAHPINQSNAHERTQNTQAREPSKAGRISYAAPSARDRHRTSRVRRCSRISACALAWAGLVPMGLAIAHPVRSGPDSAELPESDLELPLLLCTRPSPSTRTREAPNGLDSARSIQPLWPYTGTLAWAYGGHLRAFANR